MRTPPRAREQSPVQPNLDRARRSHENQQNARRGFDRTKKQENMRIRFEIIKNIKSNRKNVQIKTKRSERTKSHRRPFLVSRECHGCVTGVSRNPVGELIFSLPRASVDFLCVYIVCDVFFCCCVFSYFSKSYPPLLAFCAYKRDFG